MFHYNVVTLRIAPYHCYFFAKIKIKHFDCQVRLRLIYVNGGLIASTEVSNRNFKVEKHKQPCLKCFTCF